MGALGLMVVMTSTAAAQRVVDLPARDRAVEARLEAVYRVGSMSGADWETFGEVTQVGFDAAGNLYVMDRQNSRVVVVDRQGRRLREFGREGEGPGEWRMPAGMAVMPDGSVVISDGGHRAYLVYGPDGEFSHAVSMGGDGAISLGRLLPDPRGGAAYNSGGGSFRMRVASGPAASAGPARPEGRTIERVTLGRDGQVRPFHTAWQPPADTEPVRTSMGGGASFVSVGGPRIFEPDLHVAPLPDGGLAVVDSSAWAIDLVGPDGTVRGVLRRGIAPTRVTPPIEAAEKRRRLDELESGEGPRMQVMMRGADGSTRSLGQDQVRDMQRQRLESQGFYPEIPVVRRLRASPRGTLWIERAQVDPTRDGPVDLVSADGIYLGTLAADGPGMPDAFGPEGLVAYIERDQFDVPTIHVRRLPTEIR